MLWAPLDMAGVKRRVSDDTHDTHDTHPIRGTMLQRWAAELDTTCSHMQLISNRIEEQVVQARPSG
jgi:hypothetical protein